MGYRRSLAWHGAMILLVPLLAACAGGAPPPASSSASAEAKSPAPIIGNIEVSPEPKMEALRLPQSTQAGASQATPTPDAALPIYAKEAPPAVVNADAARRYRGTTITYYTNRMDFGG